LWLLAVAAAEAMTVALEVVEVVRVACVAP
jgi:hypothetical protein